MVQKEINMSEPVELTIQDCIEILTNIKIKHGNLPVYIVDDGLHCILIQDERVGIHYAEPDKEDINGFVEIDIRTVC